MKTTFQLLVSITLCAVAQGVYVVRTFTDATRYRDECVQQYAVRGSSLIDYMRQVALHTDDVESRWCVVRCILQKSDLLEPAAEDTQLHEANVHAQMQYSNAIVEDPDDIRAETNRCLHEPDDGAGCRRAYTFFACIQSTEYDLF